MVCLPLFPCCFNMRRVRLHVLVGWFVFWAGLPVSVVADETLAIIVQHNSDLTSLSTETLKLVYLRKQMLDSNGNRWIPLNLPTSHELRSIFSQMLFKKLPEEQDVYWNEQYFQGVSPPQVLASEEAVIRFVTITPGAIGYVHLRNVDGRVKVLKVLINSDIN